MKKNLRLLTLLFFSIVFLLQLSQAAAPIALSGKSNLVIDGQSFTSGLNGVSISLVNCTNIKIINCSFLLNSGIIGIQLQNCSKIEISGNNFKNFRSGVYAIKCAGGIDIHCNSFKDIAGAIPRGQIVQFNTCTGAGNKVNYNILDHTFGTGNPEDLINMYGSSGTTADPIQIIGNNLRGGGPSKSSGGIMVGDNGGHDILVADNILVDPGQYGIGVPAGYNITLRNNKVFGKQQSFTNVGIYVGLAGEIAAGFACKGNTIKLEGNQVNWTNKDGVKNGRYFCDCCSGIILVNNNFSATFSSSILPTTLSLSATNCGVPTTVNKLPSVSLTSPLNGSKFTTPATISIAANASDLDGTISKVEFYNGSTLLGTDLTAPYNYTWNSAPAGSFLISAKVYDNLNAVATSAIATITIKNPVVVTTSGISGLSCLTAGQTYSYSVVTESSNYSTINFWSNTGAVITQDAADKKKMTIQIPSYLNGSSFTLYSGVNYTASPWYKEYTKTIKVGSCNAKITAQLNPQPTESVTTVSLEDNQTIHSVIIFNTLGVEVYRASNTDCKSLEIGANLATGIYTLVIATDEGTTTTRLVKK